MEPEADGSFMKKTLPFAKLKPKSLLTGVELEKVHVDEKILCLYPLKNTYYEAIVKKVSKKRKSTAGLQNYLINL